MHHRPLQRRQLIRWHTHGKLSPTLYIGVQQNRWRHRLGNVVHQIHDPHVVTRYCQSVMLADPIRLKLTDHQGLLHYSPVVQLVIPRVVQPITCCVVPNELMV